MIFGFRYSILEVSFFPLQFLFVKLLFQTACFGIRTVTEYENSILLFNQRNTLQTSYLKVLFFYFFIFVYPTFRYYLSSIYLPSKMLEAFGQILNIRISVPTQHIFQSKKTLYKLRISKLEAIFLSYFFALVNPWAKKVGCLPDNRVCPKYIVNFRL